MPEYIEEIYSELDFVFICSDGTKFLTKEEAEQYQKELKHNAYSIFNK